jgi:death on curing protein
MIFLKKHQIIRINERTVATHGDNFTPPSNILNEQPLDYVLEIVDSEMFGEPLYPEIWDKTAVYDWFKTNSQSLK